MSKTFVLNKADRDNLAGLLKWWRANKTRPQNFTRFNAGPKVSGVGIATAMFQAPEDGVPGMSENKMASADCVPVISDDQGVLSVSDQPAEKVYNWSTQDIAKDGQRLLFAVKNTRDFGDKWVAISVDCDDGTDGTVSPIIGRMPTSGGVGGIGGLTAMPDMQNLSVSDLSPTVGQAASIQLTAPRIDGQPTWFVFSGSMPAGLSLDSTTGTITGTPTSSATTQVRFGVKASNGSSASDFVTFTPQVTPLALTALTDLTATIGTAHTDSVTASGGVEPYLYSISGHPTGISIDVESGAISGTPTNSQAAGNFSLVAKVTDFEGNSATASGTLVLSSAGALTAAAPSSLALTVGSFYAEAATATGGSTPYKGFTASGLPAGISIDYTSGTILGIPTSAGTSAVTVTVCDADDNTDDVTFSLVTVA